MRDRNLYQAVEDTIRHLAGLACESAYCRSTGARLVVFANRFSGSLGDPRRLSHLREEISSRLAAGNAGNGGEPSRPCDAVVIAPDSRSEIGEALRVLAARITEIVSSSGREVLLLSLGGDGTHKSVLSALILVPQELRRRVAVFRFPAGSSNDGPASSDAGAALDTLCSASDIVSLKALEIETAGGRKELGFNIASFGIDAYTSIKNEQYRSLFGGNSYRGLANIAVLFYEVFHPPGTLRLEIETDQGEVHSLEDRLILIAFGVSGGRTYGGGIPVLSGGANLCVVEHLGLFGKIGLKSRLLAGTHYNHPRVRGYRSTRIFLNGTRRLPIQIDGEARWLTMDDFPLTVHLGREHIQEIV